MTRALQLLFCCTTTTAFVTNKPGARLDGSALSYRSSSNQKNEYLTWINNPVTSRGNMQTAVTVMERIITNDNNTNKKQTVEIHAQVHFGDHEYFDYYNSPAFNNNVDAVLYELLIDESLLSPLTNSDLYGVQPKVSASPNDQAIAQQYNWNCQVDVINYTQSKKWIHADLTRQEFLHHLNAKENANNTPLWQLATKNDNINTIATQAVTALLVGPPMSSTSDSRLFTNLFWSGESLALSLRSLLWFAVPTPELSILLLDAARIFRSRQLWSPMAGPMVQALSRIRLDLARQLAFGQVLLGGQQQQSATNKNDNLIIKKRNARAVQTLLKVLPDCDRVALLYGCSHCSDLVQRLEQVGFTTVSQSWRTAWSVPLEGGSEQSLIKKDNNSIENNEDTPWWLHKRIVWGLIPIYLLVGAGDWISTWQSVIEHASQGAIDDVLISIVAYTVRHVMLYVAITKFLLDSSSPQEVSVVKSVDR